MTQFVWSNEKGIFSRERCRSRSHSSADAGLILSAQNTTKMRHHKMVIGARARWGMTFRRGVGKPPLLFDKIP